MALPGRTFHLGQGCQTLLSFKRFSFLIEDLHSGIEIQSLDRHPNDVVAVKYSQETRIVFTASSAYPRTNTTRTRSLQLPQGETLINEMSGQSSAVLSAVAGSQVRIWDIHHYVKVFEVSDGATAVLSPR
ncbi:hypothetical protein DAPPUDRAFT_239637 [Daphnia pulex]|uniref:Uncharacterized protein n=1 Tax=Daphnia pulex TaxID=6669 RepID=E9G9R0_DAPPU|nr:hypothetical protein DAPPUDRAFT_239637 [Daphnia pulex]|eukprot:EFX83841.1 hypothetical protein DAPPUDRAFT_239637 [Daphnia pulex]